jgi:membrane protease YdiL (CAAX protease family)
MIEKIKSLWLSKWRVLGFAVLVLALYWGPSYLDLLWRVMDSRAFYQLFGWLYPALELIGAAVALFIAVKLHFFNNVKSFFMVRRGRLFINIGFVVLNIVIFIVADYFGSYYASRLTNVYTTTNQLGVDSLLGALPAWYSIVGLCVVGPIFEELIFRGCIYHLFKNTRVAFVASIVLFALFHTGFSIQILFYVVPAVFITLAYHRKQRLLDSMLVHAGSNLIGNMMFVFLNSIFGLL